MKTGCKKVALQSVFLNRIVMSQDVQGEIF